MLAVIYVPTVRDTVEQRRDEGGAGGEGQGEGGEEGATTRWNVATAAKRQPAVDSRCERLSFGQAAGRQRRREVPLHAWDAKCKQLLPLGWLTA